MVPNPQARTPSPELDSLVRRIDEDRWLASRFAPADVRARLIALYALNYEIARAAEAVSEPALGDIRLAWWREAVGEIYAGAQTRAHPALAAFAAAQKEAPMSHATLASLIEARAKDLEAAPFAGWSDLEAYVDATAGGVMRLAVEACGADCAPLEAFLRHAGRAWGCAGLARAAPFWRARGRLVLPGEADEVEALLQRARAEHAMARATRPPGATFPAVGYVALVPAYARAAKQRGGVSLLARQFRLIGAAATGRL